MASCPRCGTKEVRRSHRAWPVDHMLSWINVRPYRCAFCEVRFHAFGSHHAVRRPQLQGTLTK